METNFSSISDAGRHEKYQPGLGQPPKFSTASHDGGQGIGFYNKSERRVGFQGGIIPIDGPFIRTGPTGKIAAVLEQRKQVIATAPCNL